jgi:hypothetical protein
MRRDRATASTESAIQNAHQDNHSGKAMEVVLAHAEQQGAVFCKDIPLVPSIKDVKRLVSGHRLEPGTQGPGSSKKGQLSDQAERGELTYCVGVGEALRNGTKAASEVYNAVGFFLYTQCAENLTGEWPQVLCAFRRLIPNVRLPTYLLVMHVYGAAHTACCDCSLQRLGGCLWHAPNVVEQTIETTGTRSALPDGSVRQSKAIRRLLCDQCLLPETADARQPVDLLPTPCAWVRHHLLDWRLLE